MPPAFSAGPGDSLPVRRAVADFEGLSLRGAAGIGPIDLDVPSLLWAEGRVPLAVPGEPVALESAPPTEPGIRSLRLRQGAKEVRITVPILAPEVRGGPTPPVEMAPACWSLHWPLPHEAWSALRARRPELIVLANARTLWAEGEPLSLALGELRRQLGAAPLLWAPRLARPNRIALLAYLSVDLADSTAGLLDAESGEYPDIDLGSIDRAAVDAERTVLGVRSDAPAGAAGDDVLAAYAEELRRVRVAIRAGRLRELVEARLTSEPALAEHLRYADRNLADLLEQRAPVSAGPTRGYVLRESFRRPEAGRFRDRLRSRYRPPPSKEVLLLVPCSRTKPYRASRSHRRFAQALDGLAPLARVHLVSVTSPLGLVPRELEDVPPARQYDIPVTGDWDREEERAVIDALGALLQRGRYRSIVVHLDPREYAFLHQALPEDRPVRWSCPTDRSTSDPALAGLRAAIGEALNGRAPVAGGPLAVVREELEALAGVQFSPEGAARIFHPPVRIHGRPWFQRITNAEGADLATWQEVHGLFQLTVAGAERLGAGWDVEVDAGVRLTGDLFTPGVVQADRGIRAGDAVRLVRAGELLGVGRAELPGPLMTELPHGRAVAVRHRRTPEASEANPPTST